MSPESWVWVRVEPQVTKICREKAVGWNFCSHACVIVIIMSWEGKFLEQKQKQSEIGEQNATTWQHAKFKISNFSQ